MELKTKKKILKIGKNKKNSEIIINPIIPVATNEDVKNTIKGLPSITSQYKKSDQKAKISFKNSLRNHVTKTNVIHKEKTNKSVQNNPQKIEPTRYAANDEKKISKVHKDLENDIKKVVTKQHNDNKKTEKVHAGVEKDIQKAVKQHYSKTNKENKQKVKDVNSQLDNDIKKHVSDNYNIQKPYHLGVIYKKTNSKGKTTLLAKHIKSDTLTNRVAGRIKHPSEENINNTVLNHPETKNMNKSGYVVHKIFGGYKPNHDLVTKELDKDQTRHDVEYKNNKQINNIVKESVVDNLKKAGFKIGKRIVKGTLHAVANDLHSKSGPLGQHIIKHVVKEFKPLKKKKP